jgi:hypothetical protein
VGEVQMIAQLTSRFILLFLEEMLVYKMRDLHLTVQKINTHCNRSEAGDRLTVLLLYWIV